MAWAGKQCPVMPLCPVKRCQECVMLQRQKCGNKATVSSFQGQCQQFFKIPQAFKASRFSISTSQRAKRKAFQTSSDLSGRLSMLHKWHSRNLVLRSSQTIQICQVLRVKQSHKPHGLMLEIPQKWGDFYAARLAPCLIEGKIETYWKLKTLQICFLALVWSFETDTSPIQHQSNTKRTKGRSQYINLVLTSISASHTLEKVMELRKWCCNVL